MITGINSDYYTFTYNSNDKKLYNSMPDSKANAVCESVNSGVEKIDTDVDRMGRKISNILTLFYSSRQSGYAFVRNKLLEDGKCETEADEIIEGMKNQEETEIMYKEIDILTGQIIMNGITIYVQDCPTFTEEDYAEAMDTTSDYTFLDEHGYQQDTNSINMSAGMLIRMNDDYTLRITDNAVDILINEFKDSYDTSKATMQKTADALNRFIRYANDQIMTSVYTEADSLQVVEILESAGMNLENTFTVNGIEMKVNDGMVQRSNYQEDYWSTGMPMHIVERVMRERYNYH